MSSAIIIALLLTLPSVAAAQSTLADVLKSVTYRNHGPFRAGAWVTDVAVAPGYTFYAAVRTGGVWKTTNNGTTFEPVFDSMNRASIGALAAAPSNADIVWIGTGDNSATRSAYWGDGMYKSTDAGKTWQHMGLPESHHINRVVIHPSNPDIVWVAAQGHLHTPNEERGVYKTTDGGKTWKRVLYSKDTAGAVDLVRDPRDPNVLYAAMYECQRYPWRLMDGGPASGIFKTTDGGAKWTRLETGLPNGTIGRIGLDICRTRPDVLYAVLDNLNGGEKIIGGEVYRTVDAGRTWAKMNKATDDVSRKSGYAFNQIRVDPNNSERIFITGSNLIESKDGGKTWIGLGQGSFRDERPFRRAFGDFRAFWIDPANSDRMIAASDGGVFQSYDGGRTCDHYMNFKAGEMYAIGVDMESPYNIYAGLQDHESWKAPVNGPNGSVGIEDWTTVGIGDGMYNEPDPNGRWLYNTQEFGRLGRVDMQTHTRKIIAPTRPQGQPPLRFNWIAPVRLSPHNSAIVYYGAQVLFRSLDRGEHWQEISPDLTTNDPKKISRPGGSIQHCTIVTISESPVTPGVIWTGADDGKVQVTRDGGVNWTDVTAKIGAAQDVWTSRVYASHAVAGTAYVTKTGRRTDDFKPYVFRTTDYGATWTAITAGLPLMPVNVIVEDPGNPNVLYLGNDEGIYVSFARGDGWLALRGNMPAAPVTDMVVHPRELDLVAGTYGRGAWVTNVAFLREMNNDLLAKDAHLFAVRPFAQRKEGVWGNWRLYGDRYPTTPNDPNGISIVYYLKDAAAKSVVTVADPSGALVRTLTPQPKPGIGRAVWDLDDAKGNAAQPGEYTVTLETGGTKLTQKARLLSRAPEDFPRPRQFRFQR